MPLIELSTGEIHSFSTDIYNILMDVPIHHLTEILELAYEGRMKEGEIEDLDVESESEEEKESSESDESSSEEEDNE